MMASNNCNSLYSITLQCLIIALAQQDHWDGFNPNLGGLIKGSF